MAKPGSTSRLSDDPLRAVVVRHATREDLGGLLDLYVQLAGDPPSFLPADPQLAVDIFDAISATPGRHLLAAELRGSLVGTADLLVALNLTHGGRPWAIVENVVVNETVRGEGIGRAIFDEIVRIATGAGCYKVQLLSRKQRQAAHEFYRRIGFESAAEGFRLYIP